VDYMFKTETPLLEQSSVPHSTWTCSEICNPDACQDGFEGTSVAVVRVGRHYLAVPRRMIQLFSWSHSWF